MDIISTLWTEVLYRPVYNLVIFTYQTLPGTDMGLTIIYLSLLVRILLLPASLAGSSSSRRIQELKPELDKLGRVPDHGRRRKLTRQLLRRNRVNVYATGTVLGALLLFLAVLYAVFQNGFQRDPAELAYFTVTEPIDTYFFGLFDLAAKNWWLPVITGVALYVMLSLSTPEPEPGAKLSDVWYVIALPVFVTGILLVLPSAESLFLLVSILFSLAMYAVAKYWFGVEPPQPQGGAD